VILRLVLRNLQRNWRRLRPLVLVLALTFAALFVANSVFFEANLQFSRAFRENLSADLSLSPSQAGDGFTLFGGTALLVGDLRVPPIIPSSETLFTTLAQIPSVSSFSGLITQTAQLRHGGYSRLQTLFGVDFSSYTQLFPSLELVSGAFPGPNEAGVLLQEHQFVAMNPAPEIGDMLLFSTTDGTSFTLRESPFVGVFRYPVADPLLDSIVLLDAPTARSLAGYVAAPLETADLDANQTELLFSDLDDLFSTVEESEIEPESTQSLAEKTEALLASQDDRVLQARSTQEGAWNFILLRLTPGADPADFRRDVGSVLSTNELLTRDWRSTIGGNVLIVWYLQVLVNAGLAFVALGSAIITMNALVLSVLERTREIGTLRALGAQQTFVGSLIFWETVLVVVLSALFGLGLGALILGWVNTQGYIPSNTYLQLLFGGEPLTGIFSWSIFGLHVFAAFGLAFGAVVYPVKKILSITPAKAIA